MRLDLPILCMPPNADPVEIKKAKKFIDEWNHIADMDMDSVFFLPDDFKFETMSVEIVGRQLALHRMW